MLRQILLFGSWYRLRSKDLMYQYHRPIIGLCRGGLYNGGRNWLLSQSAANNEGK